MTGPHVSARPGASRHAWLGCLALTPALVVAVVAHGTARLALVVAVVVSACLVDGIGTLFRRGNGWQAASDGSGALAALVFALCLPTGVSVGLAAGAIAVAVLIAKQLAGGKGLQLFHPGMVALAALIEMSPGLRRAPLLPTTWSLAGPPPGTVMALAVAVGAAWLLWHRCIHWRLPAGILGGAATALAIGVVAGTPSTLSAANLLLLAFFIAPDGTGSGRWRDALAGTLIGALCVLLPGAVGDIGALPFAALLGNALSPWVEGIGAASRHGASTA